MLTVLVILVDTYSSGGPRCAGIVPSSTSRIVTIGLGSLTSGTNAGSGRAGRTLRGLASTLGDSVGTTAFRRLRTMLGSPTGSKISIGTPVCIFGTPSFPCAAVMTGIRDRSSLLGLLRIARGRRVVDRITRTSNCDFTRVGGQTLLTFAPAALVVIGCANASRLRGIGRKVPTLLGRAKRGDVGDGATFGGVRGRSKSVGVLVSPSDLLDTCTGPLGCKVSRGVSLGSLGVLKDLSFRGKGVRLGMRDCARGARLGTLFRGRVGDAYPVRGAFLGCFPGSALTLFDVNVGKRRFCGILRRGRRFHGSFSVAGTTRMGSLFDTFRGSLAVNLVGMAVGDGPSFLTCTDMGGSTPLGTLCRGGSRLKLGHNRSVIGLGRGRCICGSHTVGVFFNVQSGRVCTAGSRLLCGGTYGATSPSTGRASFTSDLGNGHATFIVGTRTMLSLPIMGVLTKFNKRRCDACCSLLNGVSCLRTINGRSGTAIALRLGGGGIGTLGRVISFVGRFTKVWFGS